MRDQKLKKGIVATTYFFMVSLTVEVNEKKNRKSSRKVTMKANKFLINTTILAFEILDSHVKNKSRLQALLHFKNFS